MSGVHFATMTDAIDTTTPAGHFFFHVMASLLQMERELTAERTRAGLAAARRLGRIGGRMLPLPQIAFGRSERHDDRERAHSRRCETA